MRSLLLLTLGLFTVLQAADPAPTPKPPAPVPAKPEPPKPEPAKPQPAKPEDKKTESKPAEPAGATEKKSETTSAATKNTKKSVAEIVKGHQSIRGLFDLYMDREKGTVHLYIKNAQLGTEFIYFTHTVDGVVQAGHNRGAYGQEVIFRIQKVFDHIEFIQENTSFYFDPQSPLARSARANISHAVLAHESIVAYDEGGVLISAGNLFLKESLVMIKPNGTDASKSVLGKLSDTKSKFLALNGYPDNTIVTVEYVYENPSPGWTNDERIKADEISDARYVSIKVQHSLIKMPENDFNPRFDDPRIGYFSTQVTDMTSTEATPYRDVIHRWHLTKQKPGTALSEPVQPITFWIENTTPLELRDLIRSATLKWNEAFETAGFKDAIVVKQQPDNATWNAGDINYNVLRWTSSPNPPFGGYGPSFVNPRTGQILGADIMLEFSFLTNRLRSQHIFTELGLASAETESLLPTNKNQHFCAEAGFAQQGLLFGTTSLRLRAAAPAEMKALSNEALSKLILHEVGHTLGLNHNFRASHLYDPTTIHKKEITSKTGLTGSVMDYMPANIAPDGTQQGEFYITKPGPYDHWAINYGYSEALEDPAKEPARLDKIASLSHRPELAFANDADDMRRAGKGIDPRAMIYDMSSDPVAYGIQRCDLVNKKLLTLLKQEPKNGESWQSLTQAYITLTRESADALVAMSRYVGGVMVERAFVGQDADKKPYTPVAKAQQLAALNAMNQYAFAPNALATPADLIAHLQQQRRGFDFGIEDEAPKMLDRVAQIQRALLDHLTHVETQRRILDSSLYGNEVSLTEVMHTLSTSIFTGDDASGPNTQRQNLQSEYTDRLLRITNSGSYLPAAQSAAYGEIEFIKTQLNAQPAFKDAGAAHKKFLLYKIKRGLDES